jgi:putative CocE/NonD family hydrolase
MPTKRLIVDRDVDVPMRDGVVLRADVYRPDAPDPLPVLLQRTPYGKGFVQTHFLLMAAERGYAVVNQDTRGRWASQGEPYPFASEKQDGYDTVEWCARQPWSDGQVGMFGPSYMGYTQLAAASTHPPALKTIIPTVTFCDAYSTGHYGGAMRLGLSVTWNLVHQAFMPLAWRPLPDEEKMALGLQLIAAVDGMARGETFRHLPLADMPLLGRGGMVEFMVDSMQHPTRDAFWATLSCAHEQINIPALHIGGWYDLFIRNTLQDFAGIRARNDTPQRLLVGPWVHADYSSNAGEVDFGLIASSYLVMPEEIQLRWFDYWLKGAQNGIMDEPPVRIFVMGDNHWRTENEWPLARAEYIPYYLHSAGAANTLAGDGLLSPAPPADEPVDSFVYDPRNPVPTRGGGLCCWSPALPPGAYDQREVEARPDVLVYTTPPLEKEVEVTGPLEVRLWAATSAPDTDFTAKLVDVSPDGYARNVQDGIIRARHRDAPSPAEPIEPGVPYVFDIDVGATSNLFQAGHRIRLEISSSNFPRFDRNPNTGQPADKETELRPALQTIFHDADHPSYIRLPIIPR